MSVHNNWVEHPVKKERVETYEGWSWPGFFFNAFWLMYKGLWKKFFIIYGGIFVLGLFIPSPEASMGMGFVLGIVADVIIGIKGNEWHLDKLLEEGYEPINTEKK